MLVLALVWPGGMASAATPVKRTSAPVARARPSTKAASASSQGGVSHSRTRSGRSTKANASARRSSPKKRPRWAPVEMFHVNTREVVQLRIADSRGRAIKGANKRYDKFFRCHHTNHQHKMDPRLVRLLYEVGRHYDGRRIEVISGYRDPGVAKNPKSPHKLGLACDFRVVGIRNQELRDYLRKSFDHVGVGYYPNSSFVHLDVRTGGSAFWIDYSSPGGNSLYSENPSEDLKTGRADTFKPTAIDPAWAKEGANDSEEGNESDNPACCEEVAPATVAAPPEAPKPAE
ncbi:MAG: DUF882 domain-containing protein [Deltaproteobacteria bacterium]|nr:DUF882 domain-containing protein [Deltaproteobacteria bacterium]